MNVQSYNINLRVGTGITQNVKISQGDVGRELVFYLYDGAVRFSPPSGATVKIKGTKPSGLGFNETCVLSGSVARVFTTLAMTQEGGNIPAELEISNGAVVIGSANFMIYAEPSPHPAGTTDGTTEEARTVLAQCEEYAQQAQEAAESSTEDYTEVRSDVDDLTDRVDALEAGGSGSGLTDAVKTALLQLAQKVAYIDDDGQDYYDDLYDALYPPADLVSISAVYAQGGTVYNTDTLDSLKSDLVVTALMSDSTTQTVTNYTLSGTLTEGTSTITVTYGGKTTTFNVTVTVLPDERVLLYNWDFTESLTDTVEGITAVLGANSGVTPLERTSAGVSFTAPTQRIAFPTSIAMDMSGKTLEIDVSNFDFKGSSDYHVRFVLLNENINTSNAGWGPIIYKKDTGWASYGTTTAASQVGGWSANWNNNLGINAFDNKTVKLVFDSDGHTTSLYLNNELVGTLTRIYYSNTKHRRLLIGGVNADGGTEAEGNQCYDMTITGVRIYQNAAEAEGDSEET